MKVHLIIDCPDGVAEGFIRLNASHVARNLDGHIECLFTTTKPAVKTGLDRVADFLGFKPEQITEIVP